MFSTDIIYEVVIFSVGDTKAGTKMGKLQLRNTEDDSLLNCILWEEALNRMDSKLFRCGNLLRIVSGSFNEKFNNCLINALELVKEAKMGLNETEQEVYFKELTSYFEKISNEKQRRADWQVGFAIWGRTCVASFFCLAIPPTARLWLCIGAYVRRITGIRCYLALHKMPSCAA